MTTYDESLVGAAKWPPDSPDLPVTPLASPADGAPAAHRPESLPDLAASGASPSTPADSATSLPRTHRHGWLRRHRAGALFMASDLAALGVVAALSTAPWWQSLMMGVLLLALIAGGGFYRSRFTLSVLDDAPGLVGRALAAGALTALVTTALGATTPLATPMVALLFLLLLVALRSVSYATVRGLRRRRRIANRAVILGAGMVGQELALAMQRNPVYGLDVIGFIDDSPLVSGAASAAPVLGGTGDLPRILAEQDVDQLVIAFTATSGESMVEVVRAADRHEAEISVVPRLFELAGRGSDADEVNGLPLTRLRRAPFRSMTWPLKRVMDVTLSGLALIVLSPLLDLVALVLRFTDGRGVLFRQERVGLDGRPFQLLKFRSLRPVDEEESSTRWNIKDDERLGPAGRFIRRTSIDELPQLWNIVRGDMSLVGPRPERPYFVEAFDDAFPRYGARHRVPCGLTGWAQIHGLRGDTSIEERARFDNYYIENWSLWLDVKIILRTVGSLMRGAG